jgi:hypothetical protein
MKKFILLITLLITTSCGNEPPLPLHTVTYENFEFYVKRIEVKEFSGSNGWNHTLHMYWTVKNLEDERRFLPQVGLLLIREDESKLIYYPSNFELLKYRSYNSSLTLSRNNLEANETTYEGLERFGLSYNSNSKFDGVFTFIFLKRPDFIETSHYEFLREQADSRKRNFINKHKISSYSFNIEDTYTF